MNDTMGTMNDMGTGTTTDTMGSNADGTTNNTNGY